ncbi:Cytochrome P450 6k1 [Orchesella cincta]|uniref:Cytochrome P450 6k1 n=1 Tax=Orchesella cincta TaxID=48709 RepID=A0A1D2MIM1_ORCCI|nr:Cytochrome P450 6k1 [Orchesella cincta]
MGLIAIIAWLVLLVIVGIVAFFLYTDYKHGKYFRTRNVTYIGAGFPRMFRFLTGKIALVEAEELLWADVKKAGKSFVGFSDLLSPTFYIADLDLMKNIYVKDFDHFVNRRNFDTPGSDLLLKRMLISLEGEQWKGIRTKLSPTFTTGKIKRMFGIFDKSSQLMCEYMRKRVGSAGGEFDICESYSKFAMDVIASSAFGVDSKSFECEPGVLSEFEQMGKRFQFNFNPLEFIKLMVMLVAPKFADMLGLQAMDMEPQNYFMRVIKDVMKQRRENGERRDDFLQLMMDVKDGLLKGEENSKETLEVMTGTDDGSGAALHSQSEIKFDDDDIVANSVLFLIGGFDTTQSLLIFAAYNLALEQDVQEKLLKEVKASFDKNGGKLTYDEVLGMNYLDMVVNETLRYMPPAARLERVCTKDYKIPGTDTVIEKGTVVALPVIGIHRDERFYENPNKFDPERFTPEKKAERHPLAFAPFGHGNRNCIGMRFALVEVKSVLATLIYNFKLEPGKLTEIPVKFNNNSSLKPANGMWLKLTPRIATEE